MLGAGGDIELGEGDIEVSILGEGGYWISMMVTLLETKTGTEFINISNRIDIFNRGAMVFTEWSKVLHIFKVKVLDLSQSALIWGYTYITHLIFLQKRKIKWIEQDGRFASYSNLVVLYCIKH